MIRAIEWIAGGHPELIMEPGTIAPAWNVIGGEGQFRIAGGRTVYETVNAPDDGRQHNNRPRLWRVAADGNGLRDVNRYIDPDTPIEVLRVDGDTAYLAGWCGRVRYTDDGHPFLTGVDPTIPGAGGPGSNNNNEEVSR